MNFAPQLLSKADNILKELSNDIIDSLIPDKPQNIIDFGEIVKYNENLLTARITLGRMLSILKIVDTNAKLLFSEKKKEIYTRISSGENIQYDNISSYNQSGNPRKMNNDQRKAMADTIVFMMASKGDIANPYKYEPAIEMLETAIWTLKDCIVITQNISVAKASNAKLERDKY